MIAQLQFDLTDFEEKTRYEITLRAEAYRSLILSLACALAKREKTGRSAHSDPLDLPRDIAEAQSKALGDVLNEIEEFATELQLHDIAKSVATWRKPKNGGYMVTPA